MRGLNFFLGPKYSSEAYYYGGSSRKIAKYAQICRNMRSKYFPPVFWFSSWFLIFSISSSPKSAFLFCRICGALRTACLVRDARYRSAAETHAWTAAKRHVRISWGVLHNPTYPKMWIASKDTGWQIGVNTHAFLDHLSQDAVFSVDQLSIYTRTPV